MVINKCIGIWEPSPRADTSAVGAIHRPLRRGLSMLFISLICLLFGSNFGYLIFAAKHFVIG
jgi:hypothetical protein